MRKKIIKNSIFKDKKTTSGSASSTLVILGFLIIGLAAALSLVPQRQEIRERAAEPTIASTSKTCAEIATGYNYHLCTTSQPTGTFGCGKTDDPNPLKNHTCYYNIHEDSSASDCPSGQVCRYYDRIICGWFSYTGDCSSKCSETGCSFNFCNSFGLDGVTNKTITAGETVTVSARFPLGFGKVRYGKVNSITDRLPSSGVNTLGGGYNYATNDYPFTPLNPTGSSPDIYAFELDVYDGAWCNYLCSSGGQFYVKASGGLCSDPNGLQTWSYTQLRCKTSCPTTLHLTVNPSAGNTPTPALFSCQGLTLNGKTEKNITISLGQTVTANAQVSHYGLIAYGKTTSLSGRVANSNPQTLVKGLNSISGSFTPTQAGIYVFETNAYESSTCDFLCSPGSVLYQRKTGVPPSVCDRSVDDFQEVGPCTSTNCIKYVTVQTPVSPISSNSLIIEFVDAFPTGTPTAKTCAEIATGFNYHLCTPSLGVTPNYGCGNISDPERNFICYYDIHEDSTATDCSSPSVCRYYNRRACGWDNSTCQGGICSATGCNSSFCQSLSLDKPSVSVNQPVTVSSSFNGYGLIRYGKCPSSSPNCRVSDSVNPQTIIAGRFTISTTITPTDPGHYVFETNNYESQSCRYFCSAGGLFYKNTLSSGGSCDTSGHWQDLNLKCNQSPGCSRKYLDVLAQQPTLTPATTPRPTSPPQPTGTQPTITPTINPNRPVLNLKINFFGVYSEPDNPSDLDYKNRLVRVIINKANPVAGENVEVYRQSINFKAVTDGDQFYYKNTDLINPDIPAGKYNLFLKGPQHLQVKKKNVDLLIGMTYTYDFSAVAEMLPGGELPLPIETSNNVVILTQDGVVNSLDYGFIVNSFNKTDHDVLLVGDLNLDGIINAGDTSVLAHTLEEKLDEDE